MVVFIINILFIKIKVFVVNWFQWHQKLIHLLEATSVTDEKLKNLQSSCHLTSPIETQVIFKGLFTPKSDFTLG
jgi:hypothetical protein